MSECRRETDKYFFKRLWDIGTPWLQVVGFVIMCGFIVGTYFTRYQAVAETVEKDHIAISEVQTEYTQINQKLDDIERFLIANQRGRP